MIITFMKPGSPQASQELIKRMLLEINTAIPGVIQSFDGPSQTATVKPAIRQLVVSSYNKTTTVDLPVLIRVPVWFPYSTGTGLCLTYPVATGDQCLLVFSQRGIDNWLDHGGVQDPVGNMTPRAFSMNDAFAFVGGSPVPNQIEDFQTDGIEIRNQDRGGYVKVHENGEIEATAGTSTIVVNPSGAVTITSATALTLTGATVSINATTTAKITAPNIELAGAVSGSTIGTPIITTDGITGPLKTINDTHVHKLSSGTTGGVV